MIEGEAGGGADIQAGLAAPDDAAVFAVPAGTITGADSRLPACSRERPICFRTDRRAAWV